MGSELAIDGVLAASDTQAADIWAVRESIAEATLRRGAVWKYDVSLPLSHYYRIVEDARARFKEANIDAEVIGCKFYNVHTHTHTPKHMMILNFYFLFYIFFLKKKKS